MLLASVDLNRLWDLTFSPSLSSNPFSMLQPEGIFQSLIMWLTSQDITRQPENKERTYWRNKDLHLEKFFGVSKEGNKHAFQHILGNKNVFKSDESFHQKKLRKQKQWNKTNTQNNKIKAQSFWSFLSIWFSESWTQDLLPNGNGRMISSHSNVHRAYICNHHFFKSKENLYHLKSYFPEMFCIHT